VASLFFRRSLSSLNLASQQPGLHSSLVCCLQSTILSQVALDLKDSSNLNLRILQLNVKIRELTISFLICTQCSLLHVIRFYCGLFCILICVGFATIPSGGGGTLFGGYLVKQLNLQCRGIFRLCLVTTGTVLLLTLSLLARCENVPFAGVSVDYVLRNR